MARSRQVRANRADSETDIDSIGLAAMSSVVILFLVRGLLRGRDERWRAIGSREQRFRSLVQHASEVISVVRADGIRRYISPTTERVLGYPKQALVDVPLTDIVHPDDHAKARAFLARVAAAPTTLPSATVELRFRHADDSWRAFESIGANLLDDSAINGIVITSRDITERTAMPDRLAHQATHDHLTGLLNRAALADRLREALTGEPAPGRTLALLCLDLDRFKTINDDLGHPAGDRLVIAVGQRLRAVLGSWVTIARVGGDEFVMLVSNAEAGQATIIAERLIAALRTPIVLEQREVRLDASVGIALGHPGRDQPDDLLRNADIALYQAKTEGRGATAVFSQRLLDVVQERTTLERDLREAIENGTISVHYQPQVALASGQVVVFEALARWRHPVYGWVAPSRFIPIAEATGLIGSLGLAVLTQACRQLQVWRLNSPAPPPRLAVNLSPLQVRDPTLPVQIEAVLNEARLDPRAVEFEITESVLIEPDDAASRALARLIDLGVGLTLDDFGAGYASFACLQHLPISRLMLDRSLVIASEVRTGGLIAEAVVGLAHNLGLTVVAEGIETAGQEAACRRLGSDVGQGYLFAKPLPADAATTWLADRSPAFPARPDLRLVKGTAPLMPLDAVGSRRS